MGMTRYLCLLTATAMSATVYTASLTTVQQEIMGFSPSELVGQDFGTGDDFLKSVANQARKAYCSYVALDDSVPDVPGANGGLLSGVQREFVRSVCELPGDSVPLPPPNRAPSNLGKCQNVLYVVSSVVERGGGLGTDNFQTTVYGPVSLESRPLSGNADFVVWYLKHNGRNGATPGTGPLEDSLQSARRDSGKAYIRSATLAITNPPQVDCSRPTLPTDQTRRPVPPASNLPTVNIPIPNLPTINLPVIPLPIPIPVGGTFAPRLVIDVGGLTIDFSVGDVNITVNPKLEVPVTLFPPGYRQPALPPTIDPFTYAGLIDCCDEIQKKIEFVGSQVTKVDLATQDLKDRAVSTLNYLTGAITPLLEDIQECSCPPEGELFAAFNNLQGYEVSTEGKSIVVARVDLVNGGDVKKTFEVPNSPRVTICGWYAFGYEGRWGIRHPLQYENNICVPESGNYDGFSFGLYNGLTANGSVIVKKTEE